MRLQVVIVRLQADNFKDLTDGILDCEGPATRCTNRRFVVCSMYRG
jgi:hypothetical protein